MGCVFSLLGATSKHINLVAIRHVTTFGDPCRALCHRYHPCALHIEVVPAVRPYDVKTPKQKINFTFFTVLFNEAVNCLRLHH
jgi:hypothetical protein